MSADLDTRRGWPTELKFLVERHPRATWPAQHLASVQFWLDVHDHFRRDCAGLEMASDDFRAGRSSAAQLAVIAAPRLRGLVAGLHGHHQIEDFHYFPAFRRHEPKLAAGFDTLERDHAELQSDVSSSLAALDELRAAAERVSQSDSAALAANRYIEFAGRLCRRLCRHLGDEEDLVIPVLLERGDAGMDAHGRAT